MRKYYLAFIILLTAASSSFAQTYTWNGSISTDYQDAANWTPVRTTPAVADALIFDAITPVAVSHVPNQTIGSITIASGTSTVLLEADNPINVLTLNSATPLIFSSNANLLSGTFLTISLNNTAAFAINTGNFGIAAGTGGKIIIRSALSITGTAKLSFDVAGSGGVTVNGSIVNVSGNFACLNAGAITFNNGASYIHALNGNIIPTATWLTGSTCTINGVTNAAPTGFTTSTFYNLIWACAGQTAAVNLLPTGSIVNIAGTLTFSTTNSQTLRISTGKATINTFTYQQTTSNLVLQGGADTTSLYVSGNFTHTSGNLIGVDGSGAGTAIMDFKRNVLKSGSPAPWSSTCSNAASQMIFQFSGTAAQSVDLTGTWSNPTAGRYNVVISNTSGGVNLTGSLKVINVGSALPATCTVGGLINGSGVVTYSGVTSLIYFGSFFQTVSAVEFPATAGPTNVTINNILGVSFPTLTMPATFDRSIPGRLTMTNGNLSIGPNNTLSLTNLVLSNQLTYTGGFITTGTLGRYYPTSSLPTSAVVDARFPFGSGINDRSMFVFFSSTTLASGTPGMIYVSHTPAVNTTPIPSLPNDAGVILDKRTNTFWNIKTDGLFNINAGAEKITLTTIAANIGSVDFFNDLRLTDGTATVYGTWVNPNSGSNTIPVTSKSNLVMADINNKNLFIGGGSNNPLIIITFTWTGLGADNNWTNPANWDGAGAVGYPSASTEIAIISNTAAPRLQPTINTGDNINVYQLTVSSGLNLRMIGNAVINVFDNTSYTGATSFDPTSAFTYSSSNATQNILNLDYGSLTLSGTAQKIFPATVTVRGKYTVNVPNTYNVLLNSNTFIYAGTGAQNITAANYYNLTLTGNRGGGIVMLGVTPTAGTVDIANVFDVSGLSNYSNQPLTPTSNTIVNFSSSATQTIPGFRYPYRITNTALNPATATRIFDPLGATDPTHVIQCWTFTRPSTATTYIVTGSKVNFYAYGTEASPKTFNLGNHNFNDVEFSGDMKNIALNFADGETFIDGKLTVSLTNYSQQVRSPNKHYFIFKGAADQTIPGFKTDVATNTPSFKFSNLIVIGGNRNVTLSATDTVGITTGLQVPRAAVYNAPVAFGTVSVTPFSAGKGFKVAGSTVGFSIGSNSIPQLSIASTEPYTYNYNNIAVLGGTHTPESNNMTLGGNLYVGGTDAYPAVMAVGDASTARVFNVLGDVGVSGTSASQVTGLLDLSPGTSGSTILNISKSLSITGRGKLTSTGASNGTVVFKGALAHTYLKNQTPVYYNNDSVNFKIGDGITQGTKLTLLSSLDLMRSTSTPGTLSVLAGDSLDLRTNNLISNNTLTTGNSVFELLADATLITANTGGVEGTATTSANGSILNTAAMVKTYSPTASYMFNASTTTPFPTAITPMANLTIGASANVLLNKSIEASNTLTLNNSSILRLGNSYLNLRSTAAATAKVAPVPVSATVTYGTGRFVVERYFPARRSWRLVTAPVTADAGRTIFTSWQKGGVASFGEGTFITGPGANSAANGLDVSPQNNTSLKIGSSLTAVANTRSQLISGTTGTAGTPDNLGLFIFVRGDRSSTSLYGTSSSNNTVLRDTGRIQIGTQTFPALSTSGAFTLIGNPYASPVSFKNATRNNLTNRLWVWDPYLNSQQGGYILLDDYNNTGTYTATPPTPGNLSQLLQSSQAFYVETDVNGPASLVFNEANKGTVTNLTAFRPAGASPSSFRTNLYLSEANNQMILADGNFAQFGANFSKSISNEDVLKFGNVNEMLALQRDGKNLSLERRPDITANDTLYLRFTKSTKRNYHFEFIPASFDAFLTAFLDDKYTGQQIPLQLNDTSGYDFTVNNDAASAATDRFRIVFKATATGALPVTFKTIKAAQQGNNIAVEWTVENELNITKYDVEKSTDGVNFTKINTAAAKGTNGATVTYGFLDINALSGNNFYRIRNYNSDGSSEYSKIVLVKIGKAAAGISIYPNPVKGNTIGVSFINMEKGIYHVKLMNTLGQVFMVQQISHATGSATETLTPSSTLSTGIYQLEVTGPDKRISTIKVFVQ